MVLRVAPWPPPLSFYNPDWLLLTLAYWHFRRPQHCGVGAAWAMGLITDALTGRKLGQHALAYAVALYLTIIMETHSVTRSLFRQTLLVLIMASVAQLLVLWTQQLTMAAEFPIDYWLSPLVAAICWAPFSGLLRLTQRSFHL